MPLSSFSEVMKPCCGIRTIKGAIAWVSFIGIVNFLIQLLRSLKSFNDSCEDGESECTKTFLLTAGSSLGGALFLVIAFAMIRVSWYVSSISPFIANKLFFKMQKKYCTVQNWIF